MGVCVVELDASCMLTGGHLTYMTLTRYSRHHKASSVLEYSALLTCVLRLLCWPPGALLLLLLLLSALNRCWALTAV